MVDAVRAKQGRQGTDDPLRKDAIFQRTRDFQMTPLKLALEGSLGIRAGIGRERLELDLENMLGDEDRVVAIRGDNGSGKSTLMNLGMVPWREPPQLVGSPYQHFGETGLRELEWAHDGSRFKTRIEYRNTGKTPTQKAYLWVLAGANYNEWEPIHLPDHTVSDGKSRTYDKCLEAVLGDKDIYYLSAFRAQGGKRLAEYENAKQLMRGLLGLDGIEEKRLRTRDVIRLLSHERDGLRIDYNDAQAALARVEDDRARLERMKQDIPAIKSRLSTATDALARATAELTEATTEDLDVQRILDARAEVEARIKDAKHRYEESRASLTSDIDDLDRRWRADTKKHRRDESAAWNDIAQAKKRIAAAEDLLSQKDEIEAAIEVANSLGSALDRKEQTREELDAKLTELRELKSNVRLIEAKIEHAEQDLEGLCRKSEELTKRAGFVQIVPCQGRGKYASCVALQEAISAIDEIDTLNTVIDDKLQAKIGLQDQAAPLKRRTANFANVETQVLALRTEILETKSRLENARKVAAKATALHQATGIQKESTETIAAKEQAIAEEQKAFDEEKAKHEERIARLNRRRKEIAERYEADSNALQEDLGKLPEPTRESSIDMAKARVREAEEAKQGASQALEQTIAEIAAREAALKVGSSAEERLKTIAATGADIKERIAVLEYVAKGLRGVVDLSIEAAGPAIAEYANRLLLNAYGPRFSVKIITQRKQANGALAECFEISVIDSESGLESSVLHKSGGENVWLDKALTDAVGLYQQDAAGIEYETKFADEVEDGLTAERKLQFYRMDEAALNLGGFKRKYFVSHNPDAWEMADRVIDMSTLC